MERHPPAFRAFWVAVWAATWVVAPTWAQGQQFQQVQVRINANRILKVGSEDGGEEVSAGGNLFQPPDREDLKALSYARQLLADGRASEAIGFLQGILDGPEDFFFQPDPKSALRQSLKREAQRLIGQMSAQDRKIYELRFGAEARSLLDEACAAGDAQQLAEVSRRFFHTEAGYEATFLLGMDHLNRDRPLAGALTLRRLREQCPTAERFEPTLSLSLAASWVRSGVPAEAERVLAGLAARRDRRAIALGGREVPLFARDDEALAWLTNVLGPQKADSGREPQQWLMARGNAARTAVQDGGAPLLNMRWRVPVADHPLVEQMVEQIKETQEDTGNPSLPGFHALAVGDVVLMRTVRNLLAIDFRTGKRIWEVPVGDLMATAGQGSSQQARVSRTPQLQTSLYQRVWQDLTYGTISSDGKYVFSVEDHFLSGFNPAMPQVIIGGRAVASGGRRDCNRLAAHDIRTGKLTWHVGGGEDDYDLPLAGTFFLGPPLPLMGQVYALGEIKNEIRLFALSAKTGELRWSQQLAPVEQGYNRNLSTARRMTGASPSYADGILVCPTSTGAVVAVDLATRSLLWGYPYVLESDMEQHTRAMAMRMQWMHQRPGSGSSHWMDSLPVIVEGRVLLTPPESNYLHCLSLADGRVLWKHPREDALYLAGICEGNIALVGQRDVRAVDVETGKPAWDGRRIDLPQGANPSGRGFLCGGEYFLPLNTAEVAAIDLATGEIARVAKSRGGSVPGNLVCHRDKVISQSADGLEAFYQLDALRTIADTRLAKNPADAEALSHRGEILLNEGERLGAIRALRRSLELSEKPRTRNLLRDAVFEALGEDFAKNRNLADEALALIDTPADRATFLRLMAAGHQSVGEFSEALDRYLELAGLGGSVRQLERMSKAIAVRRDLWMQARLAGLRQSASAEFRPKLDEAVRAQLEAAKESDGPEALRGFLDSFGSLPIAEEARRELVARLRASGQLLQAELLLRQQERSSSSEEAARAAAAIAEMLRQSGRPEDAAAYYRRLGGDFAEVVCRDGKTGGQLVAALPADGEVAKLLKRESPWPVGRVELNKGSPPSARSSHHGRHVLSLDGGGEPFLGEALLLFDQNRRMLLGFDEMGRELWKPISMVKPGTNPNVFFFNRGMSKARVRGHLMVLSMGFMIQAFDLSGGKEGGDQPKLLWSQDLTDSALQSVAGNPLQFRGAIRVFQARQIQFMRYHRSGNSSLGPVTERFVCFQRMRHLTAVDAITGETRWVRSDLAPGSVLFGDDDRIFAIAPGKSYADVIRGLDGELLGKRDLPEALRRETAPRAEGADAVAANDQAAASGEILEDLAFQQYCVGQIGGNLLLWRPAGDRQTLELFDLWQQKTVWGPHEFHPEARYSLVGHEAIGVMEPSGRFALIRLADGSTLLDTALEPEPSLQGIYLSRLDGQYFLVAHCASRPGNPTRPSQPLPGTHSGRVASGRVYGFDAEGKPLWKKPVEIEDQQFLLRQPSRLPVLTFASQVYHRRPTGGGRFHVSVLCLDKRTGRVVCDEKFSNSTGMFHVSGDPEKKTVDIVTQRDRLTLTFTDKPIPADGDQATKVPPTIGEAIFSSLKKAVTEEPEVVIEEIEMPVLPRPARPVVRVEKRVKVENRVEKTPPEAPGLRPAQPAARNN